MSRETYLLGGLVLATMAITCVKIPAEVQAQFAPAQPNDNSYFRPRADAPSPAGFVVPGDLVPIVSDAGDATPMAVGSAPSPVSSEQPVSSLDSGTQDSGSTR
jgi:hypothetical protein